MKRLIALLFCPLLTWAACPSGYTYYRTITLDHTQAGSGNSTNFPAVINATVAEWKTVANSGHVQNSTTCCAATNAAPADLVFYSDNGTTITNWDCESYTATTGAIVCWLKVPTLSASVDTVMYAFYGNSGVSTYQGSATSTWDANYKAVYHVPNGTTLDVHDSTSNAANGTNTSLTAATVQIDGGFTAPGIDGTSGDLTATITSVATLSYEVWVKSNQPTTYQQNIIGQASNSGSNFFRVTYDASSGTAGTITFDGASPNTGSVTLSSGLQVLTHLAFTNNTGGNAIIYKNGVNSASGTAIALGGGTYRTTNTLFVAARPDGSYNPYRGWDGQMDEVRFSNAVRNADWFLASYNNQKTSSTFATIGSEQSCGGAAPPGQFPRIADEAVNQ